ncbi:MAG: hypothetical protein U0694_02435 [Anaerolineae bacterium]
MNDHEFLHAFESGHLHTFPHRDHIRMAWLYLRTCDENTALRKVRQGIRQLAAALGASGKYHETLTVFWVKAVRNAMTADAADFAAFEAKHPELFDAGYVKQFYSDGLLWSEAARQSWVEPDVKALA